MYQEINEDENDDDYRIIDYENDPHYVVFKYEYYGKQRLTLETIEFSLRGSLNNGILI